VTASSVSSMVLRELLRLNPRDYINKRNRLFVNPIANQRRYCPHTQENTRSQPFVARDPPVMYKFSNANAALTH
jgi:hypothetical protein